MKNKLILLPLSILFSFISCTLPNKSEFQKLVSPLQGTWKMKNSNTYETWQLQDSVVLGQSVKIENGDTILLEKLKIYVENKNIFYEALVENQNQGKPVKFRLVGKNQHELIFENKKHDFPKTIKYRFDSEQELTATVSAGKKQIQFRFKKIR